MQHHKVISTGNEEHCFWPCQRLSDVIRWLGVCTIEVTRCVRGAGADPGFWPGQVAQWSFDTRGALSPKFVQNRGFSRKIALKLHYSEKKSWGQGGPGPPGPLLWVHWWGETEAIRPRCCLHGKQTSTGTSSLNALPPLTSRDACFPFPSQEENNCAENFPCFVISSHLKLRMECMDSNVLSLLAPMHVQVSVAWRCVSGFGRQSSCRVLKGAR